MFFILMLYRYVQQILPEFSHNWLTMVGGLGNCGHSEKTSTHKHKYTYMGDLMTHTHTRAQIITDPSPCHPLPPRII